MNYNQPAKSQPDDELKFRSLLPAFPDGIPLTGAEIESALKERLSVAGGADFNALYQLSAHYSRAGRLDKAEACVRMLLELNQTPGGAAVHFLQLGELAEKQDDYELAVTYYQQGLLAGPVQTMACYFLRNNLGYSLMRIKRCAEAEPLLREAIQIDPEPANAYKNLGLSLWGLMRLDEAAKSFIDATRANAADGRALHHLEKLYKIHPQIADSIPDFDTLLKACRDAVAEAARHIPDYEAWWKQCRKDYFEK